MKILVVDDSELHREAAKAQLVAHDVTVIGSYDEARMLLGWDVFNKDEFQFEAVLVDLMMPASARSLSYPDRFAGQEMPIGIFLALLAVSNGAKYVGLLTDTDHHSHPASACLDAFMQKILAFGDTRVLFENTHSLREALRSDLGVKHFDAYAYRKDHPEAEIVVVKDWEALLDRLIAGKYW